MKTTQPLREPFLRQMLLKGFRNFDSSVDFHNGLSFCGRASFREVNSIPVPYVNKFLEKNFVKNFTICLIPRPATHAWWVCAHERGVKNLFYDCFNLTLIPDGILIRGGALSTDGQIN